ncbi:hypothetical protein, partial [Syntrophorhabdus aromaticivorans]|uniref:hypothetical protein n=1 Tax=Syntrophorhabdus aromaticivorans TaxID=328301 RepID=UPI001A9A437E
WRLTGCDRSISQAGQKKNILVYQCSYQRLSALKKRDGREERDGGATQVPVMAWQFTTVIAKENVPKSEHLSVKFLSFHAITSLSVTIVCAFINLEVTNESSGGR